jgi:hypothetical protein
MPIQESTLELKPYFHPRTYKAPNIGVVTFGFDERTEARAMIAVSLSSTRKTLRMFRESFNDLRAWRVLQGSGKEMRPPFTGGNGTGPRLATCPIEH